MDFLEKYYNEILDPLGQQCEELEKKIKRKWIFATKEEKDRLEKLNKIYEEKVEWLERQLYIESLISSDEITKF